MQASKDELMANRPLGRSTFYRGMSAPHDQNSSKDKNHSGDDKAREYKKRNGGF
ncbi:hypothetical protein ASZ90_012761 [hydrocarbon metagenome]|jgi:hypothetical protein|uniref:Uncharacterized protein n=1 Tax=hydrocarbon metagenome TaxID=938273 RepID=A0A0W8F9R6_9ZZZZ|nr:MAG: hypothetical protein METHSR3v1_940002 [Methanothrix sp.]